MKGEQLCNCGGHEEGKTGQISAPATLAVLALLTSLQYYYLFPFNTANVADVEVYPISDWNRSGLTLVGSGGIEEKIT